MIENSATYFKKYRTTLGFTNQADTKNFLAGKDITPDIDYDFINILNKRLEDIIRKLHKLSNNYPKPYNLNEFVNKNIYSPYSIVKNANLISRLNNQGRRPEAVLFSWLRGFVIAEYFTLAISDLFAVSIDSITQIGDDDLRNIETFRRTPKADFEIQKHNHTIRIEVQSGFQGVNDIKEHKLREAKRIFREKNISTVCVHIDLFNGQVAFVQLEKIRENDVNFVTRQQMEGQSVLSIDQNYFKWRLLDSLPRFDELELNL